LKESGERAHEYGEVDHLGAGVAELGEPVTLALSEPVGWGEQEAGEATRGDRRPVAFDASLVDVADEQVDGAG